MAVSPEKLAKHILDEHASKDRNFIDIEEIIKSLGIRIYRYEFSETGISGLFTWEQGKPVICVNSKHSNERQRFTMAHELYHYFRNLKDKSALRMSTSTSAPLEERQANKFAALVLMPEDKVKASKSRSVRTMARSFRVSEDAMEIRVLELKV